MALAAERPVGRPAPLGSTRKIRLGVAGGGFGTQFSFHEHPNCVVTAVTDLRADRRQLLREHYRCDNAYDSLEDMLRREKNLDAMAIFSGASVHVRHASGHGGSHVFLSAEFINALVENREPVIDVYAALAMTVPGLVGHQSALKGGERLRVPSFDRERR